MSKNYKEVNRVIRIREQAITCPHCQVEFILLRRWGMPEDSDFIDVVREIFCPFCGKKIEA